MSRRCFQRKIFPAHLPETKGINGCPYSTYPPFRKGGSMSSKRVLFLLSAFAVMVMWGCSSMPAPTQVKSQDGNSGFVMSAALTPGAALTPASATDTFPVGAMVNYGIIDQRPDSVKIKNPVVSTTWYYYGITTMNTDSSKFGPGLTEGMHRYLIAETINVTAFVALQSGQSVPVYHEIVFIMGVGVITLSQDSLLVVNQGTPVAGQTNTYSVPLMVEMANVSNIASPSPFMCGPTNYLWQWANTTLLAGASKTANGKFAIVTSNLVGGQIYVVDLGKKFILADKGGSTWMLPSEMMYNRYYVDTLHQKDGSIATHLLAFYLGYNGTSYRVDSIPADSGVAPVIVDTTIVGVYGDPYPNWRNRFTDIGTDSAIEYCNFNGLADTTSVMNLNSNISGKATVALTQVAGKKIGWTKVAKSDIPAIGYLWTYGRGAVVDTAFMSVSTYWSSTQGADWAVWKTIGLSKKLAGSVSGSLKPAGR